MTQPIKLQLNAGAVEALFPVGSTAYVELQNAVAAEFLRKYIKPSNLGDRLGAEIKTALNKQAEDISRSLKDARDKAISEVMTNYGVQKNWNSYYLPQQAIDTFQRQLHQTLDGTITKAKEEVKAKAAEAVDGLRDELAEIAQQRVNAILDEEIAKLLRQRLADLAKTL